MAAQALHDFKTSTRLVYMILNGKGWSKLWSVLQCVYFLFLKVNPIQLNMMGDPC